ncbi:FkbM family methyltransferase [Microcystis aeruginosa BLCCF158]|uniref:FkbM family methyltransferase n=2 Tax=Microcystis aeruginosa TaxID=1126 RepID=A0A841V1B1_MICAE|nr:FkbM family methyltransferase [Microcystis aeruginosa BLCC-F158]
MLKNYITSLVQSIFHSEMQRYGKDRFLLSKKENTAYHVKQAYQFLSDTELKRVLSQYKVDLVLDVGANRGQFARYVRQNIGYEGKIISFEPIKDVFEQTSQLCQSDPLWDIYNLALAEQDGEQEINVSKATELSSFLETNDYSVRFKGSESIDRREKVTKCRLDTFLKREVQNYSALKIFLKMDTQGYDLKVFAGSGDAVGSIVALQSEISVIPIYREMPHLTESINCFEREGFSIVGLFPVSREKSLRVIEYDCLMVRI